MFNQDYDFEVHVTDDPFLTVFTPEGSQETHLVRYLDPKGYIEEHLIGSKFKKTSKEFGGGADVNDGCNYQVRINGGNAVDLEPIFKNHDNMLIKKLAMTLKKTKKAVFHNKAKALKIPVNNQYLKVDFFIDGKQVTTVNAKLLTLDDGNYVAKNRKKCQVHMTLNNGEITHMFFRCPASFIEKKQEMLPSTNVPNRIQFKCDANDIDHVSGLVMALEDGMASGELENMDNHFYVINAHREALENNPDTIASAKVNASIHHVTSQMWANHIDKSLLDRGQDFIQRIKDKKALKGKSDQQLIYLLQDQVKEAETLQKGGQNATDFINYASNIAAELRRRKVLVSKNPELANLYTRLNVLVKSKGAKRMAKMKESRLLKQEKKKEFEQDIETRKTQRQFSKAPEITNNEEYEEPQSAPENAGRRIKF